MMSMQSPADGATSTPAINDSTASLPQLICDASGICAPQG
jgi:hypothetical protein